jgi:hypothetical protein
MTEQAEAQARFEQAPRPLNFIRVRLYRGGQAETVRDILNDEVDALFEELAELRGKATPEDDPKMIECISSIRHLNGALKDINNGLVELTGADGY